MRLAAAALGVERPRTREQQQEFATTRMVFVELCPYSSQQFRFADADLLALSEDDHGFRTAAEVRRILIRQGRPALVMLGGTQALGVLERLGLDGLTLGEHRTYRSASDLGKRLWHREWAFLSGRSRVPAIGFPFPRTRRTHNSSAEIDQLGVRARALVRGDRHAEAP